MPTVKYLDELQRFHVKDPAKLTDGARVLVGHVPPLKHSDLDLGTARPHAEFATVLSVESLCPNDISKEASDEDWANKAKLMIRLRSVTHPEHEARDQYAADCGVVPYSGDSYNDANFIVRLVDLEAADIELVLDVSKEYKLRLESFNANTMSFYSDAEAYMDLY
jgi:hypothetical protein